MGKIKKVLQTLILFFDKSDRKPNKIWVDKSSEITIDQWDPSYKMMI